MYCPTVQLVWILANQQHEDFLGTNYRSERVLYRLLPFRTCCSPCAWILTGFYRFTTVSRYPAAKFCLSRERERICHAQFFCDHQVCMFFAFSTAWSLLTLAIYRSCETKFCAGCGCEGATFEFCGNSDVCNTMVLTHTCRAKSPYQPPDTLLTPLSPLSLSQSRTSRINSRSENSIALI